MKNVNFELKLVFQMLLKFFLWVLWHHSRYLKGALSLALYTRKKNRDIRIRIHKNIGINVRGEFTVTNWLILLFIERITWRNTLLLSHAWWWTIAKTFFHSSRWMCRRLVTIFMICDFKEICENCNRLLWNCKARKTLPEKLLNLQIEP